MTRQEQINFVTELTKYIAEQIIEDIESERVPEHWDGFELRELLKERAAKNAWAKMSHERMKEYRNTVLVNNL